MEYEIEELTRDNWRPGMKVEPNVGGCLVRYNAHEDFGWLSCRTCRDREEAMLFVTQINGAAADTK